ncbi:MAG: hypothetical protein WCR56_03635 [Bacilli bacterium]|jgi:hypothetical protein
MSSANFDKKRIIRDVANCNSIEEVIKYSKLLGEPVNEENAVKILQYCQKASNVSDEKLESISGGVRMPGSDDIPNPPPPKFHVGQSVKFTDKIFWTKEGTIYSVFDMRVCNWYFNDYEYEYRISCNNYSGLYIRDESNLRPANK